jgi:tetratricopeptide (TPR) repeat protein
VKKSERKLRERFARRPAGEIRQALRDHLLANPLDAAAMRLLAHLDRGDGLTPLRLLERALDLCPDFIDAREDYAASLVERRAHVAFAVQAKLLLAHAPRNKQYCHGYALAMVRTGNFEAALDILTGLLRDHPGESDYWLLYAQTLRFVGRRDDSVHAYRRCLNLKPDMGAAWCGLADLKGDYISGADIDAMQAHLAGAALEPDSRMRMLYALAHALERAGDFAASFAAYDEAARLARAISRRRSNGVGASQSAEYLRRMKQVFSRENLETKLTQAPPPATAATPIFVVGMPRAGSTLVEQILASHGQVEGAGELTLIGEITRDLAASRMLAMKNAYPDCILGFGGDQLAALGARYIEGSRDYRKSTSPWFVDKRPWNWLEVGLIHLILPQARIIDIRREPMAACFAMFKQLLPDDSGFSCDLDELGRYYNDYVAMMQHWQSVLPGRVHFMQYERLVDDTENEVHRMLDYCGLPFEEGCLRFWETGRAVATPSAEQVRRPIFRDALEQWRNFEPWLDPLKAALSAPARS